MLYVQLDTNWPDNPKIIAAGLDGAGLHALVLCLLPRFPLGIPFEELWGRGVANYLICRLIDIGLLERVGGGLLRPDTESCRITGTRRHIPLPFRRAVMERDWYVCVECHSEEDLALDHIHPYSLGGPDTIENLRVLCRPCNSRKGARV